jgi:uncharacterized damage-inducible protein DinB
MTAETEFLSFSSDKLTQLLHRIETCVEKLTEEQVWAKTSGNQNSVGNLLLHLNGNVRQWILHGIAGQPDLRDRDSEFAALNGPGAPELLARLRATVEETTALLRALSSERLLERVQVQGYDRTVLAAIYHVVEHFAGHTFQIIYATKLLTDEDLGFYAHLSGPSGRKDPLP